MNREEALRSIKDEQRRKASKMYRNVLIDKYINGGVKLNMNDEINKKLIGVRRVCSYPSSKGGVIFVPKKYAGKYVIVYELNNIC